jgi:DNA-binding NtrC family response regulator
MENLNRFVDNSTIAIIDDCDIWLYVIKTWLTERYKSLTVRTYNNPDDFIKDFTNNREVDCLIIDYYLKDITAPEVIKKLRKISRDLLIITTSANFNSDNLFCEATKKALYAGSTRVSTKEPHDLEIIINTHFSIRKKSRKLLVCGDSEFFF